MMNLLPRPAWLAGLVLLLLVATLPAQDQLRVKKIEIKHVGPPAASDALIRSNIRTKEGEKFIPATSQDDINNLDKTGLFLNVHISYDFTPEGVVLIYQVQGKPRVTEIKFVGNEKYSADKLRKKITSKVGDPLNDRKLFEDTQKLREFYQKSGLQKTEIKYVPHIDENAGRASVVFEISETPKVKIIDVVFDNAQAFPQKKLRKVIKTRRSWMFAWLTGAGKLKEEQFEDDKERLSDFYRNEGYIDFELKDVKYENPTANKMIIHFVVSEGRQYKVGALSVKGAALFPTNDVVRRLKMSVGSTFTPNGLNKDLESVRDLYGAKGYIDTRVEARKSPNVETGTMDLVYEIAEGDKVFIEKIDVRGNIKTKDKVIRRELAVAPGEVFDMVRIKKSKSRLEQMNYFERVDTRPEETDVPNRRNLVVAVEEKRTGNVSLGAGFSSLESLGGFVEVTQGNFDITKWRSPRFQGAGQKLRLYAWIGLERQDYQISFVEPWFLEKKLELGVDLYHRTYSYLSDLYEERRTGAKATLRRALGSDFLIGSLGAGLENVGLMDVNPNSPSTIYHSEGDHLLARFTGSLAYDTRNNALLPNRGQRTELTAEFATGDYQFYKAELRTSWYFPGFAEGHILEVLGRVGVVESVGEGFTNPDAGQTTSYWTTNSVIDPNSGNTNFVAVQQSVTNLPPNKVPFFERYFLGGPYTLRGFRYRAVGPHEQGLRDIGMEPVGGNTYYMVSAEYSVPIIEAGSTRVRIAAFYDMGNVFYDAYDFDFAKFSANVGMGVRLNLPIGPLRLDYGYPIRRANNEGTGGRFNFTVGYTRDF